MADKQRYLLHFEFDPATQERLIRDVPRLRKLIQGLNGNDEPLQAYRSLHGDTFGYLIFSKLASQQIRAAIESPGDGVQVFEKVGSWVTPMLTSKDVLMILSVGPDWNIPQAKSRLSRWLRDTQPPQS